MELHLQCWELPRELRLMLDIVLRQEVRELPADLDWDYFQELVGQHKVQPLLIRGLKSLRPELVEACPVLKSYKGQQNRYTMEAFNRLKALAEVNSLFAANGIRMISMKGPLLSMELYGDPSMRTSHDLDVMVAWEDVQKAGDLLVSVGYELKSIPMEENPFFKTPKRRKYYDLIEREKHAVYIRGEICIELHWRGTFQTERPFAELWETREERTVLGQKISVMGREERYSALIAHGAEHGFMRLRWLLDLYELQEKPAFSWKETYDALQAQGVGVLALETLLVMYRLHLPDLPEIRWEGLELKLEDAQVHLMVSGAYAREAKQAGRLSDRAYPLFLRYAGHEDPVWRAYDRCLPRGNFEKTPLQWLMIVTGPNLCDFDWIDLPDWLFWLYFIIRPVNWIRRKIFGGKA